MGEVHFSEMTSFPFCAYPIWQGHRLAALGCWRRLAPKPLRAGPRTSAVALFAGKSLNQDDAHGIDAGTLVLYLTQLSRVF